MNSHFRFVLSWVVAGLGAVSGARAETVPSLPVFNAPVQTNDRSANAPAPAPTYTQELFLADLTQQLSERYRVNGDLQVDLIRAWKVPASGAEAVSLVVMEAPATLAPTLLVRIRLLSSAGPLVETSLLIRAQLMREVWVARAPAERGTTFDPSQFDTRLVDTLKERDAVSTTETVGNEFSLARSIASGRVLTRHDIARRALVRKGQVIEVCAVSGSLTVSMKALAIESGTAGETVRVRNLESKKEFSALVVSDAHAEVRL